MMITVRLETREGEFVHDVQVPPFSPMPEVLVWGDRTFGRGERTLGGGRDRLTYREVFAAHVVETPIQHGNGIGEPVERKYWLQAVSRQGTGRVWTHDHAMVFLARDVALPAVLRYYLDICQAHGAAGAQIRALELLTERVNRYQAANPDAVKVADVDPTRGAHLIEPNREA